MRTNWIGVVPLVVLAGCAFNAPPVEVVGADSDMANLDGEWFGEYESLDASRGGRIYFRFDQATGSAIGHVLMVSVDNPRHDHPDGLHPTHGYVDVALIQIEGTAVRGTLAPYQDLVCECELETTFQGRLDEGMIRGTFASLHRGAAEVDEGEWWAARKSHSRSP